MAVSISESLIYPILSRLPPQSFQVNLKQYEPSAPPPGRNYYTAQDKVQFLIRGEPNEFLLPDRSFVNCSLSYEQVVNGLALQGARQLAGVPLQIFQYSDRSSVNLASVQHGPCWIGQVKESINGGGLEVYNHSDPAETPFYLAMRGLNSARSVQVGSAEFDPYLVGNGSYTNANPPVFTSGTFVYSTNPTEAKNGDAPVKDRLRFLNLEGCGFGERSQRVNGCDGIINYRGVGAASKYETNGYSGQTYSIPLSYVSRIAQSSSAVPLGLIGSYAAPSWRLEMTIANTMDILTGPVIPSGMGAPLAAADYTFGEVQIRDLRISGVTVKIFDEGVMQSILALYSKAEIATVEGIPMPVSMTMATLNQEVNSYPLPTNSNQIKLLIPSTKHSVRGLFMMAVPESRIGTTSGLNAFGNKTQIRGRYIDSNDFHVNYLQAKSGGTCLQEAPQVEDNNSINGQVVSLANKAWFAQQHEQAKHLYSAFSYHSERAVQNGQTGSSFSLWNGDGTGWNQTSSGQINPIGVSFENLPHADLFQGRTQSSGIDLSNTGRLEVTLRYGELKAETVTRTIATGASEEVANTTVLKSLAEDYRLFTVLVYDQVLEVSRAGVRDISDTVLAPPAVQ